MNKRNKKVPDYESVTPFLKGQASKILKDVAENDNKPQNVIISYERYKKLKEEGADIE